ncbi:MAG: selenocysteine-specific translation elongation factor [Deltaproteobacteria bacterium]|nr:selenocysteine-specific translation elongation factor [Candidatus Anaeroferrophillacea bacterium]
MARRIILGTAGHVDHGKTTLIKALTGVDCDRLAEEKRRGITIELGFAHLTLPDGQLLGIIDVPGHERFIRNMVAGASGIDILALVVAADEGVMPQTREHLDICRLLGVNHGLVVLTKSDLVDEEWRQLVEDDIRKALAGSFLEDAPLVPVSAVTGDGIDALRQELMELASRVTERSLGGVFRLPVDRAFVIKGFGTVVTGTTLSGSVKVGDQVQLLPSGLETRVRGIQAYGHDRDEAGAGERTAINLQGLEKSQIERGEVLIHPGTLTPTSMLDIAYTHLPGAAAALKARNKLTVHCGTAAIMATVVALDGRGIEPGASGYVQLRLDEPTVAVGGDRVILRSFAWQQTVGGGRVINSHARKHRFKEYASLLPQLAVLEHGEPAAVVRALVADCGVQGILAAELAGRVALSNKQWRATVDALIGRGDLVRYDGERQALIDGELFRDLQQQVTVMLTAFHERQPLKEGISREELRSRLKLPVPLFTALTARMVRDEAIAVERDVVRLASHRVRLAADEEKLKQGLLDTYRRAGLQFPDFRELCEQLSVAEVEVKTMVGLLEKEEKLVRVRDGLYLDRGAFTGMVEMVTAYLERHGELTTPAFKDMVGLTRKYVIPLIEALDAHKVTMRRGEVRIPRK